MKRISVLLLLTAALALSAVGQDEGAKAKKDSAKASGNSATEQKLAQMEKELWEGWKNKDTAVFKKYMAAKSMNVGTSGVAGTEQAIDDLSKSDCKVAGYTVETPQYQWYDKNTVMMSYKATQDAVCGGEKVPAAVWASSVWVNQGGQWKAAFHQETAAK
jgi:hypothetical protein